MLKRAIVLASIVVCWGLCAEEPAGIPAPKPKVASVTFGDVGRVEFEPAGAGLTLRYTLDGSTPTSKSAAYCTPIRVASTLTLKAALFQADAHNGPAVTVECKRDEAGRASLPGEKGPAGTTGTEAGTTRPTAAINVDWSEVPELAEWATRAQKDAEDYYPTIAEKLRSDGFTPPRQIMLVFKKDPKGIAWATGATITYGDEWIKKHPQDTGTTVHELTHVIQSYRSRKCPGWLTEGIADWIRWFNWEPQEKRPRPNPKTAKYNNSYQDSGAFLAFLEKTYDKEIVTKINAALRGNTYSDALFQQLTGKDLPTLGQEFSDSLNKK
ncbi:MAG TPA: basic secretory protein-like protein [Planctomycetota bacterium]|jgi:hypothetical protein